MRHSGTRHEGVYCKAQGKACGRNLGVSRGKDRTDGNSGSELEEELNVKARVKCYLCDTIDHQEGWEIHVSAFLCDSEDEPHDLNAHSEGCWIDADRVYDYPFQDADRIILDKLQEVMKC